MFWLLKDLYNEIVTDLLRTYLIITMLRNLKFLVAIKTIMWSKICLRQATVRKKAKGQPGNSYPVNYYFHASIFLQWRQDKGQKKS